MSADDTKALKKVIILKEAGNVTENVDKCKDKESIRHLTDFLKSNFN